MASYELTEEQKTSIINNELQKQRLLYNAHDKAMGLSDELVEARNPGPVSELAKQYHRVITTMPEPDAFAQYKDLAKKSGLPAQMIAEDSEVRVDAVRRSIYNHGKVSGHERMRRIEEGLPATARFLKRPGNLPYITDATDSLVKSESFITSIMNGYRKGDLQQQLGILRSNQLLGGADADTEKKIAEVKRELERYTYREPDVIVGRMFYGLGTQYAQRRDQIGRGAFYAGLAVAGTAAAIATLGASVPTTLATAAGTGALAGTYTGLGMLAPGTLMTANATGAAVTSMAVNAARAAFTTGSAYEGFAQEAGLGYDELLDIRGEDGQPLDSAVARIGGLIIGAVNSRIEFTQLDMMLKSIPGMRSVLAGGAVKKALAVPAVQGYLKSAGKAGLDYLKLLGAESGQEAVQQGTNIAVRNAAKALSSGKFKYDTAGDVFTELAETFGSSAIEFSLGMIPGPLIGGVQSIRRTAKAREYRLSRAKGLAYIQSMINDAAKQGPLGKRSSEKMQEFLEDVNEQLHNPFASVYVPSQSVKVWIESNNLDEENTQELLEDMFGITQEEYSSALAGGADIELSSERFAMLNEQDEKLGKYLFNELKADPDGVQLKDIEEEIKIHKKSLRDEIAYITRAAVGAVTDEELRERAKAEGLDHVYVDAQAVQTLMQGAAPEEQSNLLESIGVSRADYEQALENGDDIEIGIDKIIDSGVPTKLFGSLRDDLRAEPGAMTVRQAREYAEQGVPGTAKEETAAWKAKAEKSVAAIESAARVKANVKAQLTLSGYNDDIAESSAKIFTAHIMRSAARMGIEPEKYYEVYANVKFVRGENGEGLLQAVWHGSPHRFDAFSLDNIGTGEGAQAYGFGLYFAGDKEVARYYRERLTRLRGESVDDVKYKGKTDTEWYEHFTRLAERGGKNQQLYYDHMSMLEDFNIGKDPLEIIEVAKELGLSPAAIDWFDKTIAQSKKRPGALYKVDIPDDGMYLLWDKPLSEQSEAVRKAWEEFRVLKNDANVVKNGDEFYMYLSAKLGSDKAASLWLKEHGIPGIKYLDGNSRNKVENAQYNYVVFDEKDVNVLETFYQQVNLNPIIINTNKLIEFDKNASAGIKELKKAALKWYRENLQTRDKDGNQKNEPASNPVLGNVFFSKRGANESIFIRRDNAKLYLIPYLRELINTGTVYTENGQYEFAVDSSKKKSGEKDIIAYSYIDNTINIQLPGEKEATNKNVRIVIEKHSDGNWQYDIGKLTNPEDNSKSPSGTYGLLYNDTNRASEGDLQQRLAQSSEKSNIQFTDNKSSRGSITLPHDFGGGAPIQITITPNADASTAIHEMSHYFLWEMKRLAEVVPNDAELGADLATTKKWLGWQEGQDDWTREQQEKWATAFEKYVREGKSPSPELRSAFSRFKKWLCDIYKNMQDLNVELTDDMRGVFDRLLATEEETDEAFMLGESEEVVGDQGNIVEEIVRAQSKKERRIKAEASKVGTLAAILNEAQRRRDLMDGDIAKGLERRISEEVRSMPVYQAIAAMSGGMKLSSDRLETEYGANVFEELPNEIYSGDGTYSADELAERFGYGSGDEMLVAIRQAPSADDEIKARMDEALGREQPPAKEAAQMADDDAYSEDSVSTLMAEREEIQEAAGTTEEDWANIEAEDEAARAAWDDPRSRPNVIKWIRENGGISYDSVKLVFGDEQAQELLKRLGPGLFRKTGMGLDVIGESMSSEGAFFGQGNVNVDQEVFDVLMGDDPALSPLEVARREGFAAARAYARKKAEERRAVKMAQSSIASAVRAEAKVLRIEKKKAKEEQRASDQASREELKARSKAAAEAVLSAAHEYINRLPYTKIYDKIKVYKAAEIKARAEYREALKAKEWERAGNAKDREILNHALLIETKKAIKDVGNARERITNQLKRSRKETGGITQDWIDQIDALFSRFGLKDTSPRINEIPGLDSFCRAQEEAGNPTPVPNWIRTGNIKMSWNNFTVSQFRDFDDTLKWLVYSGREAGRLSREFSTRNLGEVASQLADHINTNLQKLSIKNLDRAVKSKDYDETRFERYGRIFSTIAASLSKIEMITHVLDAGERLGFAWNVLFKPFDEAENNENRMMRSYTTDFNKLMSVYARKERRAMYKKKYYEVIGKNLSKSEVIAVALNTGNLVNLERVLTGFGWTEQQLRYVLESTLDERDWKFIQGVWDLIDTLWPQIASLQRDMTGWIPERVRSQMQTWHLKGFNSNKGYSVRGGYYPIAYNRNAKQNRFIRLVYEQQMLEDLFGGQWSMAQTKRGHTESRVKSTGFELRLDLGVITEHVNNVIHDLTHRKAIVDVNKILTYYVLDESGQTHRPVEEAIIGTMGEKIYNQFRPWLKYIASGEGMPSNDFETVFRWLRKRTQVVVLGLKAAVSLGQTLGWFPAMHEVGAMPLIKNIMYFYRNPLALNNKAEEIFTKSEAMRARAASRDRDLRTVVESLHRDGKMHSLQESYFWFINLFDAGVVLPIWVTAYEKALKENDWSEEKAIAYADSIVRTTQDIGTAKDLAGVQRGTDSWKIFTMFYNAMNTQMNMLMEDIWLKQAGYATKGHLLGMAMYVIVLPAIMGALLSGNGPEPNEEDDEQGLFAQLLNHPVGTAGWAAKEAAKYPFGFVPILRDAASAAFGEYGFRGSAALAPLEQFGKTFKTFDKQFEKWLDEGEPDYRRMPMSTLLLSGYVFGFPASQAKITLDAILDWMEGEKEVKPQDFFLYRKR